MKTTIKCFEITCEDNSPQWPYYTRNQTAILLGVTYSKVCHYCKQGLLKSKKEVGGIYLYLVSEVVRFAQNNAAMLTADKSRNSEQPSINLHQKNTGNEK
ncbi:MAG: hypothetical protein WKF85_03435 [Chitinophagaceae bacterium]